MSDTVIPTLGVVSRGRVPITKRREVGALEDNDDSIVVEFLLHGRNPPVDVRVDGRAPDRSGASGPRTWAAVFETAGDNAEWTAPATGATILRSEYTPAPPGLKTMLELFEIAMGEVEEWERPEHEKAAARVWLRIDLLTTRSDRTLDEAIAKETGVALDVLDAIDPTQREMLQSILLERVRVRACLAAARVGPRPFLPGVGQLRRQASLIADAIAHIVVTGCATDDDAAFTFLAFGNGQLRRHSPGERLNVEPDSSAVACLPELFDVTARRSNIDAGPRWWEQRRFKTYCVAMLEKWRLAYPPPIGRCDRHSYGPRNFRRNADVTQDELQLVTPSEEDERGLDALWGSTLERAFIDERAVVMARTRRPPPSSGREAVSKPA